MNFSQLKTSALVLKSHAFKRLATVPAIRPVVMSIVGVVAAGSTCVGLYWTYDVIGLWAVPILPVVTYLAYKRGEQLRVRFYDEATGKVKPKPRRTLLGRIFRRKSADAE